MKTEETELWGKDCKILLLRNGQYRTRRYVYDMRIPDVVSFLPERVDAIIANGMVQTSRRKNRLKSKTEKKKKKAKAKENDQVPSITPALALYLCS
jgi:hypothetical protein